MRNRVVNLNEFHLRTRSSLDSNNLSRFSLNASNGSPCVQTSILKRKSKVVKRASTAVSTNCQQDATTTLIPKPKKGPGRPKKAKLS